MTPEKNQTPSARYRVTASGLTVREGAGTNKKSVGYLQGNDIVEMLESNTSGSWLKVSRETDGLTGWVSAAYLAKLDSPIQPSGSSGFEIPPIRYDVPEPTSYNGNHIIRIELPIHYYNKSLALDYALEFSEYSQVSLALDSSFYEKGMTVEFWLKRNIGNTEPANLGFGLKINLAGRLYYPYRVAESSEPVNQSDVLEIGQWYHIAMTTNPNSSEVILYQNGVETWRGPYNENLLRYLNYNGHYVLGGSPSTLGYNDYFYGRMDEFRLWSTIRTEHEIKSYANTNVSGQDGLVCYYRFNEGQGDVIKDHSDNGIDGAASNTKWVASTRPLDYPAEQEVVVSTNSLNDGEAKPDTDPNKEEMEKNLGKVYDQASNLGIFDPYYFPNSTWIKKENDRQTAIKALPAKNVFIENYLKGLVLTFERTIGGQLTYSFNYPSEGDEQPALYLIERYRLSSYLGAYGAGRTIGTFSLLPGEETTISISSYRSEKTRSEEADSILDSYTTKTDQEFSSDLTNEAAAGSSSKASNSYKRDQMVDVKVGGKMEASYGFGSAEVHTDMEASENKSKSGATESSREEFAKNVSNTTSKHAASKSAKRDVNISARKEQEKDNKDTTIVVRKIRNINDSYTLNFVFRQMNQEFYTLLHLIDVRVMASRLPSVTLSELDQLLESALKKEYREKVKTFIVNELSRIRDYDGNIHPEFIRKHELAIKEDNQPVEYLSVNRSYTTEFRDGVTGKTIEAQGIIINADKITMRTDGVMVEAILGKGLALDDDALRVQHAEAESRELDNQIKAEQLRILRDGDKVRADIYAQLFSNTDTDTSQ